jgi:hypothetical protein
MDVQNPKVILDVAALCGGFSIRGEPPTPCPRRRDPMRVPRLITAASMALVCVTAAAPVGAEPKTFKEAKDMGLPVQNCQYCHVSKIPKKETFKVDDLNDRGKWLVAEKDKRKSKDVKGEWLKEFPGGKEQK